MINNDRFKKLRSEFVFVLTQLQYVSQRTIIIPILIRVLYTIFEPLSPFFSSDTTTEDCPFGKYKTRKIHEDRDLFLFPTPLPGGVPNPMIIRIEEWKVWFILRSYITLSHCTSYDHETVTGDLGVFHKDYDRL